ncbi:MAG: HAMP domain-containing protein [Elusimicrobia bacterium]|nr:HAMP domain-containing protein [Elusimicrobiota bacterium]MBD3412522.1 HAMP domain-containing protein [Elusimicrobiota bacterium]
MSMMKRKTLIVDRSLQLRYAGIIIAVIIVAVLIVCISALQYKIWIAPPGYEDIIFGLMRFLILAFVSFGILVTVFSVFVSHKFAGPMFRVKRVLEAVESGDLTQRVHLREKDELNDLRDTINKTIISLQKKLRNDALKTQEVLQIVQTFKHKASQLPHSDITDQLITKIANMEKKLHEIGTQFKL